MSFLAQLLGLDEDDTPAAPSVVALDPRPGIVLALPKAPSHGRALPHAQVITMAPTRAYGAPGRVLDLDAERAELAVLRRWATWA